MARWLLLSAVLLLAGACSDDGEPERKAGRPTETNATGAPCETDEECGELRCLPFPDSGPEEGKVCQP